MVLFFIYIGYIALQSAIDDPKRSDRAAALLAIVGLVILPVIWYAVNCPDPNQCAALHQRSDMSKIEGNILFSMLIMTFGFWMDSFATILARVRNTILTREAETTWVREIVEKET